MVLGHRFQKLNLDEGLRCHLDRGTLAIYSVRQR
jgi:hypothetical protein